MESLGHDLGNEVRDLIEDFIRENLSVQLEFHKAYAYYDTSFVKIKLMLRDEVVSESTEYPDF